jgi:hypothetical protein
VSFGSVVNHPQGFIDAVINPSEAVVRKKEAKPLGFVCIAYVKGVSEKFKRIGNGYNIRTMFRTQHTLRSSLMRTRPQRDPQQTAQCVYSVPCECGRSYMGETGRPLVVRLREHRRNLKEGHRVGLG